MNYKERTKEIVDSISNLEWMYEVEKINGIIEQALTTIGTEREAIGYEKGKEEAAKKAVAFFRNVAQAHNVQRCILGEIPSTQIGILANLAASQFETALLERALPPKEK